MHLAWTIDRHVERGDFLQATSLLKFCNDIRSNKRP